MPAVAISHTVSHYSCEALEEGITILTLAVQKHLTCYQEVYHRIDEDDEDRKRDYHLQIGIWIMVYSIIIY